MKKQLLCLLIMVLAVSTISTFSLADSKKLEPITVVMNAGSPNLREVQEQIKKEYPGEVNFVNFPENEMYNKVQLEMLSGGKGYDVWFTGAGGAKQYGSAGMLEPLPPLEDEDDFFKADIAQYKVADVTYGYPISADINIFYYRTDLLKAAGFDGPPKTWDEFREMAIKLTVDKNGKSSDEEGFDPNNIEVWGGEFKGSNSMAATWEFWNYLYQNEGQVIKIDEANKTYDVTIDEPEAIETLQWVVDNYSKYGIYPKGCINYDYNEFNAMFTQGRIAMAINWPFMFEQASNSKVAGKFAVGLMPKGKVNAAEIGGWSVEVFKNSTKKESAVAFVKWMVSPEEMDLYTRTSGNSIPPRYSLLEKRISEATDDSSKMLWQAINENLKYGKGVGLVATGVSWMACDTAIQTVINQALAGQVTPEEGFKQVAVKIEEIIKSNKFMEE